MSRWIGQAIGQLIGPVALATAVGCSGTVVATADATSSTTVAFITFEGSGPAMAAAAQPPVAVPAPSAPASAVSSTPGSAAPANPAPNGGAPLGDAEAGAAPTPTFATGSPASMSASAVFLRLAAGANEKIAAHLIGADLYLPDLGTCAPIEVLRDKGLPLASVNPIDLIDVGEVSVETDSARATLAARVFPDIADLISGVLYTTREGAGINLPTSGSYRLRATGSANLPPTVLQATAPGPIAGLLVDGQPVQADPLVLSRADVSLRWQPTGADIVYADLSSAEDGFVERVRCTFADEGHGVLPATILPRSATQRLAVHRLHGEPVREPGVDSGEIRFDQAVTANLRFETVQP